MQQSRLPARASVEVLGPYHLLLRIESVAKGIGGGPRFTCESECVDPLGCEQERDRICNALGYAVTEWSMPEEALKINISDLRHALDLVPQSRGQCVKPTPIRRPKIRAA